MNSIQKVWNTLDTQRRVLVIGTTVLVFGAIVLLARGAGQQDLSLLFGGLDGPAAGDVIGALEQQGVAYEVRGNAVFVPASQRDMLRMSLASEGLPAAGARGYELLDQLSGFSTTSQMFDAAYWRAKEGELARTIVASPHIQAARVHISTPSQRPFERQQSQTAAVTITSGNGIGTDHVRALQFLVAAAVPRLSPQDVAVIDDAGDLLSEGDPETGAQSADTRAEALRLRAERVLAARVGAGNAVVEVTIDATMQSEQIIERRVDPDSRIAISTEVTESSGTSNDSRNGQVTVASNLPDGEGGGNNGSSSNENSESRTLTNFDMSETERQLTRGPGEIRRLTVAVLVNEVTTRTEEGVETTVPRSAEELAALQELVASAVGFDAARGDVLTLKSLAFEPIIPMGSSATAPGMVEMLDTMQLIEVAVLALVALVLGLFVIRPIFANGVPLDAETATETKADEGPFMPEMAMAMDDDAMGGFMDGGFGGGDDAAARLRQMIADRQTEALQVLEDWIADPDAQRKAS